MQVQLGWNGGSGSSPTHRLARELLAVVASADLDDHVPAPAAPEAIGALVAPRSACFFAARRLLDHDVALKDGGAGDLCPPWTAAPSCRQDVKGISPES